MYNEESKEMRLLDFGMSRIIPEGLKNDTKVNSLLSTPKYVPPEVGHSFQYNPKSDVFQIGILFYELLHGKHPFLRFNLKEGEGFRESEIMKYSLANMCCDYQKNSSVLLKNPAIKGIIELSLEKDPEKRISIADFCRQIDHVEFSLREKANNEKEYFNERESYIGG
jgi:serine/threonine protein kinase